MGYLTVVFAVFVLYHAIHPARDHSVAASAAQDYPPSPDVPGLLSVLKNFAADLKHSRSNTRRLSSADSDVSASITNAFSSGTVPKSTDLTNASVVKDTIPHGSFRNHSIPGFGRNRLLHGSDLLSVFHNLSAVLLSNRTEPKQDSEQELKKKLNQTSDPGAASGSGSDPNSGHGVLNKTGSIPNSDPDINNRHGSNSTSNIDGISPASDPNVLLRSNSSLAPVQEIPNITMPNSGFAPVSNVTVPLVKLAPRHRLTNASGSDVASAANVLDYSSSQLVDPARNLTASNPTGGRPTNQGFFSQKEFEAALREAMAKRRQRRRMTRIKEPKCVSGRDICVLELQREIPRFIKKPKGFQVKRDARCRPNAGPEWAQMMNCCHSLVDTVNSRLQDRDAAPPAFQVLRGLKCTRFYCDEEECEYIGCKVDHPSSCTRPPTHTTTTTPTTTPSPGGSGGGGDGEGSSPYTPSSPLSTSQDPSALTGEQQKSASTTVIVVSCLLTFLAGLGGAALVFWFFRRRRATKGSEAASSHMGSTAYMAGKDDTGDSLYETLPDGKPEHQKTTAKRSAQSTASENEYTYIPESTAPRPRHRLTSEEGTSPTYSEPGDHLVHRKLPVTPLAPRAKPSLADSRSCDQKPLPASSYSLAQPVGDFHEGYSEEGRASFPAPHGYFVLEEDAAISGGSLPGKAVTSQSPAQDQGDSAGDYYSSLHSPLVGGETESQQYTALEMGGHTNPAADVDVDSEDYSRDYLEILPEYSLQKPVG